MLLNQFPDINLVRSYRNEPVSSGDNVWRNVALNIKCREADRTGVESPYSLFLNHKGHSYCTVNKNQYKIETDTFLLSRPGEQYGLIIDNLHQTEIFNIHINKDFFEGWYHAITAGDERQLDGSLSALTDPLPNLFTQLYPKDDAFNRLINELGNTGDDNEVFDAVLGRLVVYLLQSNEEVRKQIAALPLVSAAVQTEIYSRLITAKDYIHSNYTRAIDLDTLCKETAMSKFHFLRMFKSLYGVTPYQYLTRVRMEQATRLLKQTNSPVTEISDQLGFEYANSFIKAFQKAYGTSPLQYRKV